MEDDVKNAGHSKSAVNAVFLYKFFECLDISDVAVGDIGFHEYSFLPTPPEMHVFGLVETMLGLA